MQFKAHLLQNETFDVGLNTNIVLMAAAEESCPPVLRLWSWEKKHQRYGGEFASSLLGGDSNHEILVQTKRSQGHVYLNEQPTSIQLENQIADQL